MINNIQYNFKAKYNNIFKILLKKSLNIIKVLNKISANLFSKSFGLIFFSLYTEVTFLLSNPQGTIFKY